MIFLVLTYFSVVVIFPDLSFLFGGRIRGALNNVLVGVENAEQSRWAGGANPFLIFCFFLHFD